MTILEHPTSADFLIVGCGFSGAVFARLAADNGFSCKIIDQRDHIGGNSFSYLDADTGIEVHKYGPHIFHTSSLEVWDFINRFTQFNTFINRVKASAFGSIYSLPINLMTINQVFRKTFTPLEAKEYIDSLRKNIPHPSNFEEQILSSVGEEIYNLFFKYYTIKQWGVDPKNLPVSTARRIPIRFSYDDNYYTDRYQGIPLDGYTRVFERMLKHDCIHIELNTPFDMYRHSWKQHFKKLVFTGSLDDYFNHSYGYLPYRKVVFKKVYGREIQGNAVMNYTDNVTPYTRIHEHKWFTPEKKFDQSIGFEEYAEAANCTIDPYYPIRDSNSEFLYSQYRQLAQEEQDVLFVGRLAEFRYYDMHEVIGSSMSKFYALTDRNRL